jgi:single-stranded DNA-binding protein
MNKAFLFGTISSEIKTFDVREGATVTKFRVKTFSQYDHNGELKERSQTHLIDVWNPYLQKHITPLLKEGSLVQIDGAMESRNAAKQGEPPAWTTSVVLRRDGAITIYGGAASNMAVRLDAADAPKIDHSERTPPPVEEIGDDGLDVPF